jgi:hypothetical protein
VLSLFLLKFVLRANLHTDDIDQVFNLESSFSALNRRNFTILQRFCKTKLPSAVEKLSDSVPSWPPMRHREHFPSISPTLLPPHGFSAIRFAFYATSR